MTRNTLMCKAAVTYNKKIDDHNTYTSLFPTEGIHQNKHIISNCAAMPGNSGSPLYYTDEKSGRAFVVGLSEGTTFTNTVGNWLHIETNGDISEKQLQDFANSLLNYQNVYIPAELIQPEAKAVLSKYNK
jgi:hypothetical protein